MLVIFESHATTIDNEAKIASGWNDVELSEAGKQQALELGQRYKLNELDAIYCSDLKRSFMTAQLAFAGIDQSKLFIDWRLRECNYGDLTQNPSKEIEAQRASRIKEPFPNGESYTDAMKRIKSFVNDLTLKIDEFQKVMVIGSRATQYGLDHWIDGKSLELLVNEPWAWQPGWQYELTSR